MKTLDGQHSPKGTGSNQGDVQAPIVPQPQKRDGKPDRTSESERHPEREHTMYSV